MVGSFDSENSFHYNMEEDTSWDKVRIIFLLGGGAGGYYKKRPILPFSPLLPYQRNDRKIIKTNNLR